MKRILLATLSTLSLAMAHASDTANQVEQRVQSILSQMTLEEKIDLLGGVNGFDVRGVPRLGVPMMATADGPFGVRRDARSNVMAGGIGLAATWNIELAHNVGRRDRTRCAGARRAFLSRARREHLSLASERPQLRVPGRRSVPGIADRRQHRSRAYRARAWPRPSSTISVTTRSSLRHATNSIIDERTAREIYLPAFEAAVKEADVGAVMTSYNLVNGEHMSASRHFNVDVLKREWGFKGVAMSDWDATYDAFAAANGGLDLEMPSGKYLQSRATAAASARRQRSRKPRSTTRCVASCALPLDSDGWIVISSIRRFRVTTRRAGK